MYIIIGGKMNNIEVIQTTKFKNNAISLVIPVDLDHNVTGYNVLAELLKEGLKNLNPHQRFPDICKKCMGLFLISGKRRSEISCLSCSMSAFWTIVLPLMAKIL